MSQGAEAISRHQGIQAETLAGDNQAWHASQLPMIPAASKPSTRHNIHSVWVTKQRSTVEGSLWDHRGDQCSFDTMLEEFNICPPALGRLADIVRGADTDWLDLTPQSASLVTASLEFSRMYNNDLDQLEASMPLYDALYRWSRDAIEEIHDSNSRFKKD